MMPSHSCAHTALELLQSPVEALSPVYFEYETNGFPAGLYTASEIANEHSGVVVHMGGRASIGLYIGDQEKYKVIGSERALIKFLKKKLALGDKFMCIYEYDTGAGHSHCVLLSNQPIVKGRNYKKTALQKKATMKNKEHHQLRIQRKAALALAIKCVMVESLD